ncbi:polysaccharide lyase 8 family protein [Streptomyces sp. NPDC001389]|uniref:polysaccharide lyase 8 family protein n=1 Tax=Streptomyces sp. NPDC001389 TaxID=3364569 RepID=UPI0036855EC3
MTGVWSRRAFLSAAGAGALRAGASADRADAQGVGDVHGAMREAWRSLVLGAGFSEAAEPFRSRLAELGQEAGRWAAAMAPAPGALWPDLGFASDPEPMVRSFQRLRTMAEAYVRPGTALTGDGALLASVLAGLEELHAQVYHAGREPYGNWWCWRIGAPQALLDVCVLLYGELSQARRADVCAAVDHFVPDSAVAVYGGTSTGANRVDLCRVLAVRGAVGSDAAKVALARDALGPVFPYVTAGDGLHRDGSFVQHGAVAYTGTYGAVFLEGLGLLFALLKGTPWQVVDPARQNVFDAVERGWAPFLFNGLVMDAVSGRAVSRGLAASDARQVQQDDHVRGHAVLAAVLLLAEGAGTAERARWRSLVKGWAARSHHSPPLADRTLGLGALARLAELEADPSAAPLPEPVGHRLFPSMDRATHRRPGWAASLSMASRRIAHYETGNGENLRGWHTGSGMLCWWGSSYGNDQYADAFWPTVDPYRLPGVTVARKALADGAGGAWGTARPDTAWVGGSGDGEFGSVGQHLRGLGSTLEALKSWFFLGDAIVCLGAGIRASDGVPVESVVDSRNLGAAGTHALTVGGRVQPAALGWSAEFRSPGWAHLAGFGGYVLQGPGPFRALREARTGRWSEVNQGGSTAALTRRYLTLWYDHGEDPVDAGYAYQLLPGATAARTAARAATPGWPDVLANSAAAQGVAVGPLGFTGVNFWRAGAAGPLEASAPCSVTVRQRRDGTAGVYVADPARAVGELVLVWDRPVAAVRSGPPALVSARTGARLRLVFGDLSATAGVSHEVVVRLR